MNSVLWLSNYNQNLENFTAILRDGLGPIKDYDQNDLPILLINDSIETNIELLHAYEFHDLSVMEVTQPKYNKQYIAIVGELQPSDTTSPDESKTLILGYNKKWDGPDSVAVAWYNAIKYALNNKNIVGRGREVPGTFSDKSRYGETLLFTTLLENLEGYEIEPTAVYQYKFINFYASLKDDNLLKGVNLLNGTPVDDAKDLISNWIVKKSSLDLSRGLNIRNATTSEMDGDILFDVDDPEDIVMVFKPFPFASVKNIADGEDYLCEVNTEIINFHSEDIRFAKPSAQSVSIDIPKYPEYEAFLQDKVDANNILGGNQMDIVHSEYSEISTSRESGKDDFNYTLSPAFLKDGKRLRVKADTLYHYEQFESWYKTWRHYIINYLELNIPRPWVEGELISYVLTAKINGIEQVIHSDVYKYNISEVLAMMYYVDYVSATGGNPLTDDYLWSGLPSWLDSYNFKRNVGSNDVGYEEAVLFNGDASRFAYEQASPYLGILQGTSFPYYFGASLFINIAISDNFMKELLQREVSEISLYVSEGKDESFLRSVNALHPTTPPSNFYAMPKNTQKVEVNNLNNIDLTTYRIVKTYVINGKSDKIEYKTYKGQPTRTNAWQKRIATTPQCTDYYVPIGTIDAKYPGAGEPNTLCLDKVYGGTPDFILWDYPYSQPLLLNGSAKYWNGKGAKLVEVIQGRTFIAGCRDKYNVEETGIVRPSIAIAGNFSPDLFYEEDYIIVGHLPITAMIMFREQAIWFNRKEFYRIIFPNIADSTTWEFLDAESGQGTFSQKVVVSTPYGIIFANESGIWMTDGGKAQSLTDVPDQGIAVTGIYQALALGLNQMQNLALANVGEVPVNNKLGYNPHLELHYDSKNDELIVQTMIKKRYDIDVTEISKTDLQNYELDKEAIDVYGTKIYGIKTDLDYLIRMIFSFRRKNWRVEEYKQPIYNLIGPTIYNETFFTTPNAGKLAFSDQIMHQGIITNATNVFRLGIVKSTPNNRIDIYPQIEQEIPQEDIIGEIVTHEVGDGKNDIALHSALLECTAYDTDYNYNADTIPFGLAIRLNDPFFGYELRNRETQYDTLVSNIIEDDLLNTTPTDAQDSGLYWEDLMRLNFLAKGINKSNPFMTTMQTPTMINVNTSGFGEVGVGRESFALLAPLRTHGRRIRFRWISKRVNKVKSFVLRLIFHKRRSY